MKSRNKKSVNSHEVVREVIRELVRMWQKAGTTRKDGFDRTGVSLGIKSRVVKGLFYDEPEFALKDWDAENAERREPLGWLYLADEFMQLAEYCEAKAEQARLKNSHDQLLARGGDNKWVGQSYLKSVA